MQPNTPTLDPALAKRLVAALDALPKKELGRRSIYNHDTGCFCALGAMLRVRKGHHWLIAAVSEATMCSLEYILDATSSQLLAITSENDGMDSDISPGTRWTRMRAWAEEQGKTNDE